MARGKTKLGTNQNSAYTQVQLNADGGDGRFVQF